MHLHNPQTFSRAKETGNRTELIDPRHFKRPESVLVVVHTSTEALLIKRADHHNFWQSVTGSLKWGETPMAAADREVQEETGLSGYHHRNSGISRSYSILEPWLHRYPPNTLRNREHLFFCELEHKPLIRLNPAEHTEFKWLNFRAAAETVFSWSNRLAFESLD